MTYYVNQSSGYFVWNPVHASLPRTSPFFLFLALQNYDINVIRLDWSKYAKNEYILASNAVRKVGKDFGNFLIWMHSQGLSYSKTHLQGHSLGSHVSAIAARFVKQQQGSLIKRLSGKLFVFFILLYTQAYGSSDGKHACYIIYVYSN